MVVHVLCSWEAAVHTFDHSWNKVDVNIMMMTTMMTMTTIVKTTMTNVIPLNFLFDVGVSYIFYRFKFFVSSIILSTQAFPNGDS